MSEFSDVAIVREANVYFEGKVTSRTIRFPGGESKTLGIMLPGEYSFNTDVAEHMEVLAGDLDIRCPAKPAGVQSPVASPLRCQQAHRFRCASVRLRITAVRI